ncbi:MAG: hypothetical protein AB1894_17850 [Chloroflexota bacterium]
MKLDDLLQQERSRRQALAASERTDKFRELLETNLGCRHAPARHARRSPAQYLADLLGMIL